MGQRNAQPVPLHVLRVYLFQRIVRYFLPAMPIHLLGLHLSTRPAFVNWYTLGLCLVLIRGASNATYPILERRECLYTRVIRNFCISQRATLNVRLMLDNASGAPTRSAAFGIVRSLYVVVVVNQRYEEVNELDCVALFYSDCEYHSLHVAFVRTLSFYGHERPSAMSVLLLARSWHGVFHVSLKSHGTHLFRERPNSITGTPVQHS